MRRAGAALELVRIAWRHHRGLTMVLVVLVASEAMVPAVLALSVGALLRSVANGSSLVVPLLAFGAVTALPLNEARWRVADQLGMRVGDVLDQRLMAAVVSPPGLAHLDDPALRDEVQRAATFWNSSLVDGVVSIVITRLGAVLSIVVLARSVGWVPALVLAAVWCGAGAWSWRVASRGLDAQWDKGEELREVEYVTEVALSPAAGKDVRTYRLGPWFVERQQRLWADAMEPIWRARRAQVPGSVAVCAAVAAAHVLVVVALGRTGGGAPAAATALAALLETAGLGVVPFGHYEMEFGLRTVPANRAVVEGVRSERFALGGREPARAAMREIRFEGVSFGYPAGDGATVLEAVDLTLPAGRSTAVVGVNGAGKSTLVKLLCRFYDPTAGRITVDDVDLATMDPAGWQRQVTGLFQDFVRYPLSARDNIGLRPDDTDRGGHEDVIAAADLAGILDELLALPDGLDTFITRAFGGHELSGGQWQRVALARAIHGVRRGAGLLVLDEPTAHLDAKAESALYDRFLDVTRGVTTVLVSHRFSTVRRADRIVVLDGGSVAEQGTHDELVTLGGTYARLFTLQAARFEDQT